MNRYVWAQCGGVSESLGVGGAAWCWWECGNTWVGETERGSGPRVTASAHGGWGLARQGDRTHTRIPCRCPLSLRPPEGLGMGNSKGNQCGDQQAPQMFPLDRQDGPCGPRPHLGKDLCHGLLRGSWMEPGPCSGSRPCAHISMTAPLGREPGHHTSYARIGPPEQAMQGWISGSQP